MHGMKIYLVTPYHGSRSSSNNSAVPPAGPPPSLINSSIPLPPVLPPCPSMNGPSHHHHSMLPQQTLSLENHPALQLLRMPLGERQFGPTSLNAPSLFPRPSSQDFRVDMLATPSSNSGNNNNTEGSQQYHRMNHHHQQHLPPHTAPSIPGLGMPGFDPHNPFIDRGPLGLDTRPRPPSMSLGFEPQMDFYSQRLRQLAGATSPTTVSASPRKLTPPFTHPPMSSSSQPSTPTSTPQPVLNLHTSSSDNQTPAPSQQHNSSQEHRGSSASSTSSKGGNATDVAEGSPKLMKTWSCEFCGKAFRFQSNLIVHRRSHTGEKPYKCPICRHSCSQASKLKRHMKTHQSNNGKATPGSENNSVESPRSTPDSTSEAGKERRQRRRSIDEDEDNSDGQTADNEEEEEDLDDEDEEEDELDDEEDLDDSNEVMMAEDLSTRGPNSSTPVPRESPNTENNKTKSTPEDVVANNDNNSSNTISISNGENGNNSGDREISKPEPRHSLISEVMDKIGLSNIQQYNEAYQKALEESSLKNSSKEESESSKPPVTENGPERLNNREDGNNNNNNSNSHGGNNKSHPFHHSMEFGPGFFGAFDYHHHNAFEMSKRLKLDMAEHLRNTTERESLYAGLWLPSVHGSSRHRDLFDTSDLSRHGKSSESALKSVTPTNLSPRPGTSGASVAPLLLNSTKGGGTAKERRNDTCEFCGKVFKNCSNLTVHRRSHTGEKPYKCELCSYACAQSSKLTRHMKTHGRLGKDVYRCRFCDMPFSVPSTLEKHMRKCVVNQNASYVDRDSDSKDLT